MSKKKINTKSKTSLAPIQKTHPERISENENIEKYDQIINKMANSSDEIIDRVLDRLEGKQTSSQPVQKPQEETKPEVVSNKNSVQDVSESIEQKYIKLTAELSALKTDKAKLEEFLKLEKSNTKKLSLENERLVSKISELEEKIKNFETSGVGGVMSENIDDLIKKSDNLLLKNSELEFEISRLRAENTIINKKLETISNEKRMASRPIPKENYTQVKQIRRPYITMNGYTSWN